MVDPKETVRGPKLNIEKRASLPKPSLRMRMTMEMMRASNMRSLMMMDMIMAIAGDDVRQILGDEVERQRV